MKRAVLLAIMGMIFAFGVNGAARAGVMICNQFDEAIYFALGYVDSGDPTSTGWFQIDKGKCGTYLADATNVPFFYVYGESDSSENGWDAADDKPGQDFCLSNDDQFTLHNSKYMKDGALACPQDDSDRFIAITEKQDGVPKFTFTADNAK
jgi:uncharacterized membrane protein